ncbi:ATP-binding protein [Streptomyces sp. BH097]|uniref:ATP-binding protein n=1 Tax=unclassified Streptomyces TaxID=2593676 RepID=UPI003BB5F784
MRATPRPTAVPQDIEWRFPRHARSVARARRLFREQATSWGLPPDTTDTAELLLSELMTNAYRHAKVPPGREIRARAFLDGGLRVEVTDASPALPALRTPSVGGGVGPRPDAGEAARGQLGNAAARGRRGQDGLVRTGVHVLRAGRTA